jgi:hypothetical protein
MPCFVLIVKPLATARMTSALFAEPTHLTNLFRIVGGTLRNQRTKLDGDGAKTAKYNLELIAKVREISAPELSLIIEAMTQLAQAGMAVDSLRINVDTVFKPESQLRAA